MSITVNSGVHDETRRNLRGALYFDSTGTPVTPEDDENLPDGSLRIVPSTDGLGGKPELKADGVWNPTSWEVAGASLKLGLDLKLSAAGDWLRTHDVNLDIDALAPHIEFTDDGTFPYCHVPILGVHLFDQVVQSDFSTDNIAAIHGSTNIVPIEILGTGHRHKTGATAATDSVRVSHYHGTDNTGVLFWRATLPASQFPASSDVLIELDGMAEAFPSEEIYTEFVSDTAFSLLGNVGGDPYTSWDFFPVTEENIVTFETGLDRIVTAGGAVVCAGGNVVTAVRGH